jgi:hypothetical protein
MTENPNVDFSFSLTHCSVWWFVFQYQLRLFGSLWQMNCQGSFTQERESIQHALWQTDCWHGYSTNLDLYSWEKVESWGAQLCSRG